METYIRQRQLIMSPLITSHVIAENEPLTSVLNKVIAAKEVNHKGQGAQPCTQLGGGGGPSELGPWTLAPSLSSSGVTHTLLGTAHLSSLLRAVHTEGHPESTRH